jgi:hypothetical protein
MAETLMCDREDGAALLPSRPYQAVAYHYGMLLGVDDFNADQASHRGKVRLHNAWLHGYGVVWGLRVSIDTDRGELRVEPGLALDGAGRELHNDVPQCVNVGAWFAAHRDDEGFSFTETEDGVEFEAEVVIRHRACLARPVPAMLDTCAGASSDTAFSRVLETVEILIRPGQAPAPPRRGRLLRVLLGLEPAATDEEGAVLADDQAALDGAAEIAAAAPTDRLATVAAVHHRIAVLDTMADKAGIETDEVELGLYPDSAPEELVLAAVTGIALAGPGPDAGAPRWTLTAGTVDNMVRPVLLATSVLQDLVTAAAAPGAGIESGPRVISETVARTGAEVKLTVDRPLLADTVKPAAFSASKFDGGWSDVSVDDAQLSADGLEVTLTLGADPGAALLRLRAVGEGQAPLLGDNKLPLFGAAADRPSSPSDALRGADFIWHG